MSKYYLPGVGGQVDNSDEESPFQMNFLMNFLILPDYLDHLHN